MQPGEEIESLVDELEQIVNEAKSPLMDNGQKKIVDAQDVYEILDEIRRVFPQEFQDARRIIKEEQETLDRAQQQASSIIADAQQQAMILAGDQEIVRLARPVRARHPLQRRGVRRHGARPPRGEPQEPHELGLARAPDPRRELRPAQHHQQRALVA